MNIGQLLQRGKERHAAIESVDGSVSTYGDLRRQLGLTTHALAAAGISRGETVATVLSDGPLAASAFLSIGAATTVAPLNRAYRGEDFEFYLTDLDARLLVVAAGDAVPAIDVARRLGIPIAELHPAGSPALFELHRLEPAPPGGPPEPPSADDVALILHTSGTTSRPKMVPLSQRNLCSSAQAVARSLALDSRDRCLAIMPLFHIHGLVAALLASLFAGGTVICSPGFSALTFYRWLRDCRPTWYTGVPTMHHDILRRAPRNRETIDSVSLRLIRSCSASLPPQLMHELESTFGAPVIEAYGMTEAAHQMTSNPLPPAERKAGTVGIAAGPEIAVMDEDGALLAAEEIGEVVIRGANVTSGYLANAAANADAFINGWFRTGDQGAIDDDGYLRLTGRLKEIINRGGEKISPREIDEVLLDHPAVSQAVTFALADERLGEEVAAAVVLEPDHAASAEAVREFARQRLPAFKVPRRIVIVEAIPKGPTGKLQRIGLASKLGLYE